MRSAYLGLALLLCLASSVAVQAGTDADYRKAIATIRCDCGCHPQSVEDCACGRAAAMRTEIQALVEGTSGLAPMDSSGVVAHYVARSGDQILIAPAAEGFNLLAWLGPLIGLLLSIVAAAFVLRRFSRQTNDAPAPVVAVPVADDDPYREKLRQQLAELD